MNVLKVSSKSSANSVAGALAAAIREAGASEIQAIGAGAVNQAVKAIAIASGFVAPLGITIYAQPVFEEIKIGEEERTAIRFKITSEKCWFFTVFVKKLLTYIVKNGNILP